MLLIQDIKTLASGRYFSGYEKVFIEEFLFNVPRRILPHFATRPVIIACYVQYLAYAVGRTVSHPLWDRVHASLSLYGYIRVRIWVGCNLGGLMPSGGGPHLG